MSEAATIHDLKRNGATDEAQANDNPVVLALMKSNNALRAVLPKHMTPERVSRLALGVLRNNATLARAAQSNPASFAHAVVSASQLGLEVGVFGDAHLVPFRRRDGKYEVTLIPGYQGLVKLVRNSGHVVDVYAHEVRERDTFDMSYGLERTLKHKPLSHGGFPASDDERGEVVGFYAVAVYRDGTRTFQPVSLAHVLKTRDASRGYQAAKRDGKEHPWDTHFEAMGRKTAIRALCNLLPKSPELAAAIALDNAHDRGASATLEGDYTVQTDDDEHGDNDADGAATAGNDPSPPRNPNPPRSAERVDTDTGEITGDERPTQQPRTQSRRARNDISAE